MHPIRVSGLHFALLALIATLSTLPGAAVAEDRIDQLIQRLEEQDRQIEALRQELMELRAATAPLQQQDETPREEWGRQAEESEVPTEYDNPAIRVDIAAQINQAINFAGDGAETKATSSTTRPRTPERA